MAAGLATYTLTELYALRDDLDYRVRELENRDTIWDSGAQRLADLRAELRDVKVELARRTPST